jgi:uncharacterized protein (TIGR00299 family) protein
VTRALYFDVVGGAAGDMIVGALLDLGVQGLDLQWLEGALAGLELRGYTLALDRVERQAIAAAKFRVIVGEAAGAHHHRSYRDIRRLIERSTVPDRARALALDIFRALAEAEGLVHGVPAEEVTFHEVGAVDSIVDVVAAALCLDRLGSPPCFASPLPMSRGRVNSQHGVLPLPAPATAHLLRGVPLVHVSGSVERVTPTGAAILKTVVEEWCDFPPAPIPRAEGGSGSGGGRPGRGVEIQRVGYGAGDRDDADLPNVLRVFELAWAGGGTRDGRVRERITVLETNLDDAAPETLGYVSERLAAGALDAFVTPVVAKKSRPAHLLTVLCREADRQALADLLFAETTTLGVRSRVVEREALARREVVVETPWGPIGAKLASRADGVVTAHADYDACAAAARRHGVPLARVMEQVARVALREAAGRP